MARQMEKHPLTIVIRRNTAISSEVPSDVFVVLTISNSRRDSLPTWRRTFLRRHAFLLGDKSGPT